MVPGRRGEDQIYAADGLWLRSPNEKIDDKIIVGIRTAEFMVADVTLERPNVYFEAGFAMALGRPVIWTALRGEVLHFDIRQFNFIEWDTPADLREKPRDRVQATIPSARTRLGRRA